MFVWLSFAAYLLYLFLRFLIHNFQNQILWRFNGAYNHLKTITSKDDVSKKTCQILSILYRKKYGLGLASIDSFIWWHEDFVEPDVLVTDPRWSLLILDENFAYFGLLPEPWNYYNARRTTFIHAVQFEETIKMARMPLHKFSKFADEKLDDPKGPVVHYSMAARSGSTLLAKAMQVSEDKIICFSEPHPFKSFSTLLKNGKIPEELAIGLSKAIIKFYCKTQLPGQTYFIKQIFFSHLVIQCVKKAMPQVKHIYSQRKNFQNLCASFEKLIKSVFDYEVMIDMWNLNPWLASRVIDYGSHEMDLQEKFGMKDSLDMSIIYCISSIYYYHQCQDIFDIPVIFFEDLIEKKEETLREVFRVCELSYEQFGDQALKIFDYDSQSGTPLSRDKMKSRQATVFDEPRMKKINLMCDELKIPRIEFY